MNRQKEKSDTGYSMRVVARMTGLTPDAIRAWERRYGAVVPSRSDGNTRRYSSEDVHRLGLLHQATNFGHSIKNIAGLSTEQLEKLVDDASTTIIGSTAKAGVGRVDILAQLKQDYLFAIEKFEVRQANDLLSRAATFLNPSEFVLKLVLPILRETGERWARHDLNVAQEHLVSAQVKSLMHRLINMPGNTPGAEKVIIATPANHLHEFGAMVAALLTAARGFEPIYLGPNLPESDILEAVRLSNADILILSIARDLIPQEADDLSVSLGRIANEIEVWFGLPPGNSFEQKIDNVRFFNEFEKLDLALAQRMN